MTQITQDIQNRYQSLQKQHQDFANHLNNQTVQQQQQLDQFKQQLQQAQQQAAAGERTYKLLVDFRFDNLKYPPPPPKSDLLMKNLLETWAMSWKITVSLSICRHS